MMGESRDFQTLKRSPFKETTHRTIWNTRYRGRETLQNSIRQDRNLSFHNGNWREPLISCKDLKIHNGLKFITWNIAGLEEKFLELRTKAICKKIIENDADIVFLQEVVPDSLKLFLEHLPPYEIIYDEEFIHDEDFNYDEDYNDGAQSADDNNESSANDDDDEESSGDDHSSYFTAILLKRTTVKLEQRLLIPFPNSNMGRNLSKVNAQFKDVSLTLLNTHLESTFKCSDERKMQLQMALKEVTAAPEKEMVIFAGDMNLRDKELRDIGGLPLGIEDAWEACGEPCHLFFTWDMTQNNNLNVNGFNKKFRFDRIYFRTKTMEPSFYTLIGKERLLPYRYFPSDHWGILCHFGCTP